MAIEEALTAQLEGIAALTALVGTRIYPLMLPQNFTLPAVTYQRITGSIEREITGPAGKARAEFQVDYWSETWTGAREGAEIIRKNLDGKQDLTATPNISVISLQSRRDIYEQDADIYRRSQDFLVSHIESQT